MYLSYVLLIMRGCIVPLFRCARSEPQHILNWFAKGESGS
jgi:hypothetical protein